jgi:hypothetical protein
MSAEQIRTHFVRSLGPDVGVSFSNPDNPCEVVLYRPDRLSEPLVRWAFERLQMSAPAAAKQIERLIVSYETRLGRTRRSINIVSSSLGPEQPHKATFTD